MWEFVGIAGAIIAAWIGFRWLATARSVADNNQGQPGRAMEDREPVVRGAGGPTPERSGGRWKHLSNLNIPLQINYADANGVLTSRRIDVLAIYRDFGEENPFDLAMRAWCHLRRDERTFYTSRVQGAKDGATGEVIPTADLGIWLMMQAGEHPTSPRPEAPPGRLSMRRLRTPPKVTVQRRRAQGDIETFDVEITEIELAGRVPFAFSGWATRRRAPQQRGITGHRRFRLRMTDGGDPPITSLTTAGADAPDSAPHRWLAEQKGK
ncbi:hypothetical protein [Plastoroseomonas arctica]|uniref:WYL domain-containing protein n=1 Tax=Plastoroseomonas arctica TaxID=1509237 RepID=A0AAF1K4X3_9PROT|nr:hypothetical protein [Plastoroseomonas arctica]MBR0655775.1 hypothetical protein [Plastoroseomonas arctica]